MAQTQPPQQCGKGRASAAGAVGVGGTVKSEGACFLLGNSWLDYPLDMEIVVRSHSVSVDLLSRQHNHLGGLRARAASIVSYPRTLEVSSYRGKNFGTVVTAP